MQEAARTETMFGVTPVGRSSGQRGVRIADGRYADSASPSISGGRLAFIVAVVFRHGDAICGGFLYHRASNFQRLMAPASVDP